MHWHEVVGQVHARTQSSKVELGDWYLMVPAFLM